ncbi:unnamed protein product [Camellia sinensis]
MVSFLKNHVNIASGTPSRMKKLIDMEALGLTRLAVIMLGMQTDVKGYSLLTLPRVRDELWDLYKNNLHPRLVQDGSSIGLVKSMQPAISNPASADSVISSKTDPNLCFATHTHSSISFSGLSMESSAADHQDWCFSNGSHGRAASIVS